MTHRPTPWQIEKGTLYLSTMHPSPIFELVPLLGDENEHQANAAHIVKCVNAHDGLVAALELADEWLSCVEDHLQDSPQFKQDREQINAALAKAGAL